MNFKLIIAAIDQNEFAYREAWRECRHYTRVDFCAGLAVRLVAGQFEAF